MEEGLSFKGKSAKIDSAIVWKTWKTLPAYWADVAARVPRRLLDGHHARRRDARVVHELRHGRALLEEQGQVRRRRDRGRVAPETAAHAAGTSALLPMLTLGIPGSPTAAVLLGRLLIWGLQPGPLLFVEKKDFVWGLIASHVPRQHRRPRHRADHGAVVGAILRIPFAIIAPVIVVICAIGAYTVHNNMFDVVMMMVFGVVGYVFKKLKYPLAPLVLALVLGDMAETAFRQSMLLSAATWASSGRIPWSGPSSPLRSCCFPGRSSAR
jgi:putative tricarboxylic transport membrane protein